MCCKTIKLFAQIPEDHLLSIAMSVWSDRSFCSWYKKQKPASIASQSTTDFRNFRSNSLPMLKASDQNAGFSMKRSLSYGGESQQASEQDKYKISSTTHCTWKVLSSGISSRSSSGNASLDWGVAVDDVVLTEIKQMANEINKDQY